MNDARTRVLEAYAESLRRRRASPDAARPLLVGEDNPHGGRPESALFPHPPGSAGERLQRLVLGVSTVDYLANFDRANLCRGKWDKREAARAASVFLESNGVLVLLGAKVCAAFDLEYLPFSAHTVHDLGGTPGVDLPPGTIGTGAVRRIVRLPHPSGRCRAWNEPESIGRAREALRSAGVLKSCKWCEQSPCDGGLPGEPCPSTGGHHG